MIICLVFLRPLGLRLVHTETKQLTIKTLAKTAPTVAIVNPTKTQTSIGFGISVTDPDSLYALTKIELIHANGTVEATSLDVRAFENLLSNNDYTVKITYTYDLNDGEGVHTETKEITVHTDPKVAPVVNLTVDKVTETSISYSYTVTDVDNVLLSLTVKLLDADGNIVASKTGTSGVFENVASSQLYTVVAEPLFDLNDGIGSQSLQFTQTTVTVKIIEVKTPSQVTAGKTYEIEITPQAIPGVRYTSVVIDGKEYPLTYFASVYTVVLTIDENADSAWYSPTIETLIFDGGTAPIKSDLGIEILIKGKCKATIESVTLSNGKSYFYAGDSVSVLLNIPGLEHYTLQSITIQDVELTRISETEYAIVSVAEGCTRIGRMDLVLLEEEFGLEYKLTVYYLDFLVIPAIDETTVVEIHTPEDLMSMTGGYYERHVYVLMNDIDLSGYEWTPPSIGGYFYGNGHTIRNVTILEDSGIGGSNSSMFSAISGYVIGVNFENITLKWYRPGGNTLFANEFGLGLIDGHCWTTDFDKMCKFVDCRLTGTVEIYAETVFLSSGYTFTDTVGGFCGNGGIFVDCHSEVTFVLSVINLDNSHDPMGDKPIDMGAICGRGASIIKNCTGKMDFIFLLDEKESMRMEITELGGKTLYLK